MEKIFQTIEVSEERKNKLIDIFDDIKEYISANEDDIDLQIVIDYIEDVNNLLISTEDFLSIPYDKIKVELASLCYDIENIINAICYRRRNSDTLLQYPLIQFLINLEKKLRYLKSYILKLKEL